MTLVSWFSPTGTAISLTRRWASVRFCVGTNSRLMFWKMPPTKGRLSARAGLAPFTPSSTVKAVARLAAVARERCAHRGRILFRAGTFSGSSA